MSTNRVLLRSSPSSLVFNNSRRAYWIGTSSRTTISPLQLYFHKNSTSNNNPLVALSSRRFYTPFTDDEKEKERLRVSSLTPFQKDQELRQLNRKIAKLEVLRGINTGELYTWSGRYKQLSRDYGMPMMMYYFGCWSITGLSILGLIQVSGIDTMTWIETVDSYMNWNIASKVDPQMGKIGMTLLLNELIEPIRLPIVILTVKPVVDRLFPPKF